MRTLLRTALTQWCEAQPALSPASCTRSPVDRDSCGWYHGVWPFLRAAGMVSSPDWHHDFYNVWIQRAVELEPARSILVSGTADFSMPAYAQFHSRAGQRIVVADQCRTPLDASEWYARRQNAAIAVHQADFLVDDIGGDNVGVILSDALLTRFAPGDAAELVRRWFDKLQPGGLVITTVRVRDGHGPAPDEEAGRQLFASRFRKVVEQPGGVRGRFSVTALVHAASVYAERMTSNDLGNGDRVLSYFRAIGFTIVHERTVTVSGEFSPTRYLQIVAEKPGVYLRR